MTVDRQESEGVKHLTMGQLSLETRSKVIVMWEKGCRVSEI